MAISSSGAPFQRGKTFYGGRTIDTANYEGIQLEGQVVVFASMQAPDGSPVQPQYDGSDVRAVIVRNTSGITLLPKRLVSFASNSSKRVDGYTATTAGQVAGVVDPLLPSTGVVNGDLFYVIVQDDNCLVKYTATPANAVASVGDILYAETAASSVVSTTAGRCQPFISPFTATQTTDGTALRVSVNEIGRAKSAKTTGETNSDMLVRLRIK